jgi:hypothetical protein
MKPDIADAGRCRKGRLKCLEIRGQSPRYEVFWQHLCRGFVAWILSTKMINAKRSSENLM